MGLVPLLLRLALVSLVIAGLARPAFAGGLMPGNGGSIVLPSVLPPSLRDYFQPPESTSGGFATLAQKFGVQNGRLDFFSGRSSGGGDFKPLMRGGFGDGGLSFQLKW